MPQLSDLRREQSRGNNLGATVELDGVYEGEERLVIDRRACCSMSTIVEEKLARLHQQASQFFGIKSRS